MNDLNQIDTQEIINKSKTLWQHHLMDIFYNINNNSLMCEIYSTANKINHRQHILNNVGVFTVFVATIYDEITKEDLINMLADKVFNHFNQEQVLLNKYQSALFSHDEASIYVLDINNEEKHNKSPFCSNNLGEITTTSQYQANGEPFDDLFEITEDGNLTTKNSFDDMKTDNA